jgi:hypothetical protein
MKHQIPEKQTTELAVTTEVCHRYVPGDIICRAASDREFQIESVQLSRDSIATYVLTEGQKWNVCSVDSEYFLVGGPRFVRELRVSRVLVTIPMNLFGYLDRGLFMKTNLFIDATGILRRTDIRRAELTSNYRFIVELSDGRVAAHTSGHIGGLLEDQSER